MEYHLPTCFVSHYQHRTLEAKHYATHNSLVYSFIYEFDAGEVFKLSKEKGTIIHERIKESPSRIDKLEEIFSNLNTAFASARTIEKTPVKIGKTTHVTKRKGATSSNNSKEELKMISIQPDFVEVIREPFDKNEFFEFVPRSIVIENIYAKSLKNSKCLIEELDKDDKT